MLYSDKNNLAITEKNQYLAVIDGKLCKTLADTYFKISKALQFPDYFDANLDGLYDCLCDLSWIQEEHVRLVIMRSELLLSQESGEEKTAFLDTLRDAEENQYESTRTLEFILFGQNHV